MPNSVMVGSRPPSSCLIFSYSSGVRPCSRIISGVRRGMEEELIWGNHIVAQMAPAAVACRREPLAGQGAATSLWHCRKSEALAPLPDRRRDTAALLYTVP